MNNVLGRPVKSIFSRAALAVINACAKFVYNFAYGFGIKLTESSGSIVISMDTESEALARWIRETAVKATTEDANENLEPTSTPDDDGDSQSLMPEGMSLDETEWVRGETVKQIKNDNDEWEDYEDKDGNKVKIGIRMQVVSRIKRVYDTDYYFWRWAYYDTAGCLYKLSAEQGVFAEVNYDVFLGS